MTGYGKAEVEINGKRITAEVRSLNSKQLDLGVRLPHAYRPYEHELRSLAGKGLQRGKADLFVSVAGHDDNNAESIDASLFGQFCGQVRAVCAANGLSVSDDALLATVLRMPDVVSSDAAGIPQSETEALTAVVSAAIERLDAFRAQEGAQLMADMLARVDLIRGMKDSVEPYEKPRADFYRNRIRENIASMNIPVDSNRLEQEMIFYIEKLDITEEKVRLENHCRYFHEVAAAEENPGRKLGFIAQEMGREINTLGSKANDASIQKIVVGMKDELEKIKEQILNIL